MASLWNRLWWLQIYMEWRSSVLINQIPCMKEDSLMTTTPCTGAENVACESTSYVGKMTHLGSGFPNLFDMEGTDLHVY